MEIKHIETSKEKGQFDAYFDGVKVGTLTYTYMAEKIIGADHTYVNRDMRGNNIASELFDSLIDFAQDNGLKIKPYCSYIIRKFQDRSDLDYLLEK